MKRSIFLLLALLPIYACELEDINEPGNIVPLTVQHDDQLPNLEINGTKLHLETFGDIEKPILIFLHGGPGADYRAMISERGVENASAYPQERSFQNAGLLRLKATYFCIFYDRRGSGLSTRFDRKDLSLQVQIDDLNTIVDYFLALKEQQTGVRTNKVNLFGLSFGGYLSTAYINQNPDKVNKVVLYEPRPFTEEAFDLLDLTGPFEQLGQEWIDEQATVGTHITPDSHERADYLRAIGASNNATPEFKETRDITYWRLGAYVFFEIEREILNDEPNIVDNLSRFEGDLLFLYGEKTEAAPDLEAFLNQMINYYPKGERLAIPNAGHNGHWENPDAVSQAIKSFLE